MSPEIRSVVDALEAERLRPVPPPPAPNTTPLSPAQIAELVDAVMPRRSTSPKRYDLRLVRNAA